MGKVLEVSRPRQPRAPARFPSIVTEEPTRADVGWSPPKTG